MRKKILLAFFGFLIFQQTFAAWGLFDLDRSYAIFDVKGTPNTRIVWNNGVGNIQNYDFGTFITGNIFQIDGYDVKTWKNDGSDVTGGTFKYVIYPKGNRPSSPVFKSMTLGFITNLEGDGNQKWGFSGANIDLLDELSSGEYTLEFFCEVYGNNPSATIYDNNLGANYISHFRFNYFRSDGDGAWSTASNWVDDILPSSGVDIEISSNINVDGSISCNNLIVNNSRVLTINSTHSLSVTGTLTNNAGNSGIVIKSDASGTGSLKHNTAGVAATFERNFDNTDWADPTDGWHYLSSPVAAQAISPGFITDPIANYDLYVWYEPENLWVNHKNTSTAPTWATANVISNGLTNNTSNFLVGKGYLVAYKDGGVKEFSGTLNVSDVNISDLTITGSTNANRSWHLLGNPFSCALTWDGTAAWNLSNISGVAKIWDESSRALVDLTSSPASIIPATNGFLVQVSSGTGSLTIPASKREHSSLDFYKSGASTSRFLLTASTFNGESAQQSNIYVNPEASEGFDLLFDSEFLAGYAPQFYSIAGDLKLSTNTLPSLPDDAIIPFGFVKNEATQFNITMQEQISGYIVYLNDLLTGVEHNLTDQPVYSFTSAEGDDPNRFLLYFAPVSVNKPAQSNACGIYSYAGQVYISNTPSNARITLSTLTGQVAMQRNTGGSGLLTLNAASLPKGVYIVTIQGEGARVSRKVVL